MLLIPNSVSGPISGICVCFFASLSAVSFPSILYNNLLISIPSLSVYSLVLSTSAASRNPLHTWSCLKIRIWSYESLRQIAPCHLYNSGVTVGKMLNLMFCKSYKKLSRVNFWAIEYQLPSSFKPYIRLPVLIWKYHPFVKTLCQVEMEDEKQKVIQKRETGLFGEVSLDMPRFTPSYRAGWWWVPNLQE